MKKRLDLGIKTQLFFSPIQNTAVRIPAWEKNPYATINVEMLPKISQVHAAGTRDVIATYYVGNYMILTFTSVWQTVERVTKSEGIQRGRERLKRVGETFMKRKH